MSLSPHRIVLVGFMAAGKTAVGRALAERLGWGFRDLDTWIEEQTGRSVPELFEERGEAGFREVERRAALEARGLRNHVIAAGGGAFAEPETRAALRDDAISVWLRCRLETLLARIGDGDGRPLARNREKIARLFAEREASYSLAEFVVEADEGTPEEVAQRVARVVFGTLERPTASER